MHERTMKDALDDIQHGVEIGNIVFQMPEDEVTIAGIMVALKRQISMATIETQDLMTIEYICPECRCTNAKKCNYCWNCGQAIINL